MRIFILMFLTTLSFGAAREAQPLGRDALASKLKFYAKIHELEAAFHQTKFLNEMGVQLKSEGRFKLKRPDEVVWEIEKPSHVLIEMGREQIRFTMGEGAAASTRVIKISEIPQEKDLRSLKSLVAWLELDADALNRQYAVYALNAQSFRFVPRDAIQASFKELEMTLAKSGQLSRLVIHEPSGDKLDISFDAPKIFK